ncbi:MAG: type II toxin-antitoxin system RelE/ParE family toxin [Oscillospiraceae bacterium]|nr:type II toxin-antitoxin system RelE/ParE family toxin [Oscillospiraceae bacterium]
MPKDVEKYTVVIHDPATEMLLQHVRFLADVSESAAKRLASEFNKKAKTLETMPERCPWVDHPLIPKDVYRKLIFEKHYMLIYKIIDAVVHVDAMVDCRQDYIWLLL